MKKMKLQLAAVIAAAVCILITGTALALSNTWGLMDFLTDRRGNTEVLPGAAGIVQTDVPQEIRPAEGASQEDKPAEMAAFSVREAIFDGQNIYIVVEARPASPEYLLLGTDAYPQDPIGNMGPLFDGKGGTISDYAAENNKTMLHTFIGVSAVSCAIDFLLEDDGTLVYMLSAGYEGESAGALELEISCGAAPFIEKNGEQILDEANTQRLALTAVLGNTGTRGSVSSTESVNFENCGVRVDKVTLTGSEMAIYVEIEYTVTDAEKFAKTGDDGHRFALVDENGRRLPSGAATGVGSVAADGGEARFISRDSLAAAEVLPDEIILREYIDADGNEYEEHTVKLK